MSNAFTAERERNWQVRTSHKRTFTGTLKACVSWINKSRRKNERIIMKSGQSLYSRTDSIEARRDRR
jgi:small nuclear ribonucleoprotein (snRNP)-like protein